jgi:hypothetical protein
MAPRKCIEKMVATYEQMFGTKPRQDVASPLNKGDHPEMDMSDELDREGVTQHQSLIGAIQKIPARILLGLPAGQEDTWGNKEEFQRKNHLLALLQCLEKGLPCSPIDRLSCGTSPAAQTDAGLLCEGPWLALLSCWAFGMQCPSPQRTLGASGEQARFHMKANGSELGSCKSWSCQARRQGLRLGSGCSATSRAALALRASQPLA